MEMLILVTIFLLTPSLSSSSPLTCDSSPNTFFHHLHRLCPLQIPSSQPIQMDGESLEQVLRSTPKDVHTAVLFYDSDSPFSSSIRSYFDVLNSMFPQVGHIAVEQSMAKPSLFSRFGVHSLPALFIVNQAKEIRYYGPKELHALVDFYKRSTGLDPEAHIDITSNSSLQIVVQPWYQSSLREIIVKEPYLVFSILFMVFQLIHYIFPEIWSRVSAFWMLCKCQFSVGILQESNHLLGRVAHLMDVKRVWSKLKLSKTGNFQKGARSARVWASSLASVSLGESTSARSSSVES